MQYSHDFFNAVKQGDLPTIEQFLADDPNLASARDPGGTSAVLTALYYHQPQVAALLIERGAMLNLFEASAAGEIETVRSTLDRAPRQVNSWSPDSFQPLGLASFFGHTELVRELLERGAEVSAASHNLLTVQPLHSAVAGRHFEIARMLLEHGADPNALQGEDFTPLHGAAQNCQVEMVRLLLEHGADPTLANSTGQRPVDMARAVGCADIVEMLGG